MVMLSFIPTAPSHPLRPFLPARPVLTPRCAGWRRNSAKAWRTCPRMSTSQPATPPPTPAETALPSSFRVTRLFIFLQISTIYSLYVTLRSTFTYAAPLLSLEYRGIPLSTIRTITSTFPLPYALSRFLTGFLIDRTKPHQALYLGVLLAGLTNVVMSFCTAPNLMAVCWGLKGLVQGVGASASAKMITAWFNRKERGLFWSLWSSSANVGAFIAPITVAWLARGRGFGFDIGLNWWEYQAVARRCIAASVFTG